MNLFLRSVNVQRSFIHSIPASKKERNITTDFFFNWGNQNSFNVNKEETGTVCWICSKLIVLSKHMKLEWLNLQRFYNVKSFDKLFSNVILTSRGSWMSTLRFCYRPWSVSLLWTLSIVVTWVVIMRLLYFVFSKVFAPN